MAVNLFLSDFAVFSVDVEGTANRSDVCAYNYGDIEGTLASAKVAVNV